MAGAVKTVRLDDEVLRVRELRGALFESDVDGYSGAVEYAGVGGYIASLPQVVKARCIAMGDASTFKKDPIMDGYIKTSTEIANGVDEKGDYVVVVSHGAGILADPSRMRKALQDGLAGYCSAAVTKDEVRMILAGGLSKKAQVPVLSVEDIFSGNALPAADYRVAVRMDDARKSRAQFVIDDVIDVLSGSKRDDLGQYALLVACMGGVEQTALYLSRLKSRYDGDFTMVGSLFDFKHYLKDMDPDVFQANLLVLGADHRGVFCDSPLDSGDGYFVAVKGDDVVKFDAASLRELKRTDNKRLIGAVGAATLLTAGAFVGITNSTVDENRAYVRSEVVRELSSLVQSGEITPAQATGILRMSKLSYLDALRARNVDDAIRSAKENANSLKSRK